MKTSDEKNGIWSSQEDSFAELNDMRQVMLSLLEDTNEAKETALRSAEAEKKKADELLKAYAILQDKTTRLEEFQKITVGRELDMIKLKEEVNALLVKMGQPIRYEEVDEIRKKEQEIRK